MEKQGHGEYHGPNMEFTIILFGCPNFSMENLTFYLSVLRNNDQSIIVFANHTKVINEERGAVDGLRVISKV